jgi:4-carboxymuconolactone decarboxylase
MRRQPLSGSSPPDQGYFGKTDGTERTTGTADHKTEPFGAQRMLGGLRPGLLGFTDDVLFGQVWTRCQLSPKERSLVTVACLTTSGNTEQLGHHLGLAKRSEASEQELIEVITHLAFYAGWPKAMSVMGVA